MDCNGTRLKISSIQCSMDQEFRLYVALLLKGLKERRDHIEVDVEEGDADQDNLTILILYKCIQ